MQHRHEVVSLPRGRTRLILRGELDAPATVEIHTALAGRSIDEVDTSAVTFIGAAGLSLLLAVAGDDGIAVIPSPMTGRLIEICQLGDRLRIVS